MTIFPTGWTDEELLTILDETNTWTVSGGLDLVFCLTLSLRDALERAALYREGGATVQRIFRHPSDDIVVLPAQMLQLTKIIARRAPG